MVSPNPASPEAPPAVWSAIRALAHGHHLTGAEGLPQEHGEGALDVQDGGGPLRGGRVGGWRVSSALPRLTALKAGRTQGSRLSTPATPALKAQIPTGAWPEKMNEGSAARAPGHRCPLGARRPQGGVGTGADQGRQETPTPVKGSATSHPPKNVGPPC